MVATTQQACFTFYCALQMMDFLHVEGVWQSALSFQQYCSLGVAMSHFGNSQNISDFFNIIYYCDL